jgi:hypothetical protein
MDDAIGAAVFKRPGVFIQASDGSGNLASWLAADHGNFRPPVALAPLGVL